MCQQPTVVKIDFLSYIKFVYKVLLYSALIPFKYNVNTKRLEYCLFNRILSQVTYITLSFFYGGLICILFTLILCYYTDYMHPRVEEMRSTEVQDIILAMSQLFLRYLYSYLFACNYLKRGRCLLPIVNEMLDIFNRLKPYSDSLVYLHPSLVLPAIAKMYFLVVRIKKDYDELYLTIFTMNDVFVLHSYLVWLAMSVTYLLFQVVLMCFYLKMNEFLGQSFEFQTNREISRYLRRFIAISNRIHRIKKQLDWLYTVLFIASYIEMLSDIYHTYSSLHILLFDSKDTHWSRIVYRLAMQIPVCVIASFEISLLCMLSGKLIDSEEAFKRRVRELIDERDLYSHKRLQRIVELMCHQDLLRRVHTLAFEKVQLDQQFAFEYFIKAILINVITCLQYYASKEVYSQ